MDSKLIILTIAVTFTFSLSSQAKQDDAINKLLNNVEDSSELIVEEETNDMFTLQEEEAVEEETEEVAEESSWGNLLSSISEAVKEAWDSAIGEEGFLSVSDTQEDVELATEQDEALEEAPIEDALLEGVQPELEEATIASGRTIIADPQDEARPAESLSVEDSIASATDSATLDSQEQYQEETVETVADTNEVSFDSSIEPAKAKTSLGTSQSYQAEAATTSASIETAGKSLTDSAAGDNSSKTANTKPDATGGENYGVKEELNEDGAKVAGNAEQNGLKTRKGGNGEANAATSARAIVITSLLPTHYRDGSGSLAQNHNEAGPTGYKFNQNDTPLADRTAGSERRVLREYEVSKKQPFVLVAHNDTIPNEGLHSLTAFATDDGGNRIGVLQGEQTVRAWTKEEGRAAVNPTDGPSIEMLVNYQTASQFFQQDSIGGRSFHFEVACSIHPELVFRGILTTNGQDGLNGGPEGNELTPGGGHNSVQHRYLKSSPAHVMADFIDQITSRLGSKI